MKAQHYIPKFYLKGFTDRAGVLWVCERFKPIRPSKPKHEAHRPDYYTITEAGEREEIAEDALKAIESQAAPIICKIGNPQYRLTPETAGHLYFFVAFMFARVPAMREYLDILAAQTARTLHQRLASDKQKFYESCRGYEKATGNSLGIEYEELRQYVLNGKYEVIQKSVAFNLGAMFDSGFRVLDQLMSFNYRLLYAPPGTYFVTSDSPVITILPDGKGAAGVGVGFGWPGVEVYFPLNKRVCLMLKKGVAVDTYEVSSAAVRQINRFTMHCADQYLYIPENHRRTARLFDQWGHRIKPGLNAFMPGPRPE